MEFGTLPQTIVLSSLPSEQSEWLSHFFAISTHPPPVMHLNYLHFNAIKCKYVPPSEMSKRTNKQFMNKFGFTTHTIIAHFECIQCKTLDFIRNKKKHCTKNGFVNVRSAFFSFIFDWLQTITIRIRATRQTNLIGCAFANGIIFINFIFAIWWAIAYSGARQTLVRDIITCEFIVITQRILDVFR